MIFFHFHTFLRVYPSLQTLTEPHRLTQSLQILSRVCVVIARDRLPNSGEIVQRMPVKSLEDFEANKKSYRRHAIILMNNLLPGLDINDAAKCGLVFQVNNWHYLKEGSFSYFLSF